MGNPQFLYAFGFLLFLLFDGFGELLELEVLHEPLEFGLVV